MARIVSFEHIVPPPLEDSTLTPVPDWVSAPTGPNSLRTGLAYPERARCAFSAVCIFALVFTSLFRASVEFARMYHELALKA
jgi:hypothetical protein